MIILAFFGVYFLGVISGIGILGMMAATDVDDHDEDEQ